MDAERKPPLIDTFIAKTAGLTYRPHAIFPSEMFFLYLSIYDFGPRDHIVESGVGYGGSTSYLARLFPETRITSIDWDRRGLLRKLVQRFKEDHPNVELIRGDSTSLLLPLVKNSPAKRIAVLIDGPKHAPAVRLAEAALDVNPKVELVAIHDITIKDQHNSHHPGFRATYAWLDFGCGEYLKHYPKGPGLSILRRR